MATHRRGSRPSQWPVRDLLGPHRPRAPRDARAAAAVGGLLACGVAVTTALAVAAGSAPAPDVAGPAVTRPPEPEMPQWPDPVLPGVEDDVAAPPGPGAMPRAWRVPAAGRPRPARARAGTPITACLVAELATLPHERLAALLGTPARRLVPLRAAPVAGGPAGEDEDGEDRHERDRADRDDVDEGSDREAADHDGDDHAADRDRDRDRDKDKDKDKDKEEGEDEDEKKDEDDEGADDRPDHADRDDAGHDRDDEDEDDDRAGREDADRDGDDRDADDRDGGARPDRAAGGGAGTPACRPAMAFLAGSGDPGPVLRRIDARALLRALAELQAAGPRAAPGAG